MPSFIPDAAAFEKRLSGLPVVKHPAREVVLAGDLSILRDFALFRNRRPPSAVVDRLRERGFLAKTARGRNRMTLKGWLAILLRQTTARRAITGTVPVRCVLVYMGSKSEYLANARECEGRAQDIPQLFGTRFSAWRHIGES
jgi:hypothetical protein